MAALSHGARHLRQGIGIPARSIHIPASNPSPSTAQRILTASRSFFSRLLSARAPSLAFSRPQPSLIRPTNAHSINTRFSLPVKHALSRPFSPPRLPKPPVVPQNVTHVGLGTARAFHSGRPIFQNMVDNVPVATRALWEAEWDVKVKKKEARRMRRTAQNKIVQKSREMSKPKHKLLIPVPSDLDLYFPVEPTPVTTQLLVPLAPTPTTRLPLYARSQDGGARPLLPISDLASVHANHRLHSLRVSTLFARLDSANVWHDPGVNVDAYAFGSSLDSQQRQCTILRVTFKGWNAHRVRAILGHCPEEWYSIEETLDQWPPLFPPIDVKHDERADMHSQSSSFDSCSASQPEMHDEFDVLSSLPIRATASAEHDLVLPTLDLSSKLTDAPENAPLLPQPVFLRTASELMDDTEPASVSTTPTLPIGNSQMNGSWECLALSSSFLGRVDEQHRDEVVIGV